MIAIKEHEAQKQAEEHPTETRTAPVTNDKKNYQINKEEQKQQRKLSREVADLENHLDSLTQQKDQIEAKMTEPDVFNDVGKLQDLQKELESVNHQMEVTETSWEEKSIQLEDMKSS